MNTNRISLIVLSVIFLIVGCNSSEKTEHESTLKLTVSSPLVTDTLAVKNYVAKVKSIQHIELRALEKGYLKEIYVDEGEFVKKGKLLFKVMPLLYKAEAKKAEAEAQYAKIEYLNTKSLSDQKIVSKNELALAKAKYDKALAELDLANIHLSFTEIRAPFDGIVGRFHVRLGSLLEEGELLTELSDNSNVWVYFNLPEAEYLNYASKFDANSSNEVSLLMANNKLFSHKGKIETIESDFNSETGNIAFRATFPNPENLLRHGETGNIQVASSIENAIIIPQKSTFEILDKTYVYIVNEDNTIRSQAVRIDLELPNIYVIGAGLKSTDKILIDGLRKVKAGDEIDGQFVKSKEILDNLDLYAE